MVSFGQPTRMKTFTFILDFPIKMTAPILSEVLWMPWWEMPWGASEIDVRLHRLYCVTASIFHFMRKKLWFAGRYSPDGWVLRSELYPKPDNPPSAASISRSGCMPSLNIEIPFWSSPSIGQIQTFSCLMAGRYFSVAPPRLPDFGARSSSRFHWQSCSCTGCQLSSLFCKERTGRLHLFLTIVLRPPTSSICWCPPCFKSPSPGRHGAEGWFFRCFAG